MREKLDINAGHAREHARDGPSRKGRERSLWCTALLARGVAPTAALRRALFKVGHDLERLLDGDVFAATQLVVVTLNDECLG